MMASASSGTTEPDDVPATKRQCCKVQGELSERQLREPRSVESTSMDTLWLDDNYVAVSKPPDVRMDGEHDVTLEKLVSWVVFVFLIWHS